MPASTDLRPDVVVPLINATEICHLLPTFDPDGVVRSLNLMMLRYASLLLYPAIFQGNRAVKYQFFGRRVLVERKIPFSDKLVTFSGQSAGQVGFDIGLRDNM